MSQIKERKSIFGKLFGGGSKSQPKAEKVQKRSRISQLSPISSSADLSIPPPPPKTAQPPFTFSGKDAEECQVFVRKVWQFAHQRAKESDERWKAGLAGFCMVGAAKEWYDNDVDAQTKNDWDLLKVALGERFRTTRDLSEAIPTVPDTPPPSLEQPLFMWFCDHSQRDANPSYNPTIPAPAAVITAEPSLPQWPHLTFAGHDSNTTRVKHPPPSSPSRSIAFTKPIDLNKSMEGYIRIVTWEEQAIYIGPGRSFSNKGCYSPTANSLGASQLKFNPSEDRYALKLTRAVAPKQWLAIAWSSYDESPLDVARIVASTIPTSSSCWLSCSMPDVKGPIRPFVWSIYPDGSIAVNYYDHKGVRCRLTAVVLDTVGSTKNESSIILVKDYDQFVTHHQQAQPGEFGYRPARLVFQHGFNQNPTIFGAPMHS